MARAASSKNVAQHADWRPSHDEIAALAHGRHGDPFSILGLHSDGGILSVRVYAPEAGKADLVAPDGEKLLAELEPYGQPGFFLQRLTRRKKLPDYRLRLERDGARWIVDDPYRFPPLLGEFDLHLIAEGKHENLYDALGAHPMQAAGSEGVRFAVWAPNAMRVSIVGDFNAWDGRRHPMRKRHEAGVWELFVPGVNEGVRYKYEILDAQGGLLPLKADPFSFRQEAPPETASIVTVRDEVEWTDAGWLQSRQDAQALDAPVSIYEVHFGSWRREHEDQWPSYEWMTEQLVPYVKDMGFSHIELLPMAEHPFTGSWGYQPIGLFAPTSRYGSPEGFMHFVDACHREGLGVLVDWVPAHFPSDSHGLARFDGTALYEHEDPRLGFHPDWNTLIYNYERREVANFLLASGDYWLKRFHVDGLRVDAVASMLYLDYSREAGQWIPNIHGGNENLGAIDFLKNLNLHVGEHGEGAITVAEESTAWPQVSRPVYTGGLGFHYKWNMGWMHDTLAYIANDPIHRRYHHSRLTFGLLYAFSENFILPLSHDEVVHGKGSLIGKMPGDHWQKFANLRAYFGFMWTHPGKKLLFMGGEFAQFREWNHDRSLDWHLLEAHEHAGVQRLVRDLNHLYRDLPSLHRKDCHPGGFEWIDASDADQSVITYLRRGNEGDAPVVVVCNFTPITRHGYRVGVPAGGFWRERLNTDAAVYGGTNIGNGGGMQASDFACHGRPYSLDLTLPPLSTCVFEASHS